jgi:2-methylisocitrate lyase-like PEP mutase family enzyme
MGFRELHQGPGPLLLPNAWDVPSALAFVHDGFAAIGTTSFGVASAAGLPDGARASRDATLSLARSLQGLPAHLSVDIEDGYDDAPGDVAAVVAELGRAGVAGVNIEDSTAEALVDPEVHAAKIAAVTAAAPGVFVNARVDTYWLGRRATPEETLARARRYVEAGADGVFVPGATEPGLLRELAAAIPVPVNVLAHPTLTLAELGELGIRRVSTGSLPYRAAVHAAGAAVRAIRDGSPPPPATPYVELQDRLRSAARLPGGDS